MSDMSPSQRIIADANRTNEVKDSLGRTIRYRRLGALDRARLFKAVGPEQATNAPYIGLAIVASSATEVDGVPLPFPSNDGLIEASIARLGDEGLEAVSAGLIRDRIATNKAAADAATPQADAGSATGQAAG